MADKPEDQNEAFDMAYIAESAVDELIPGKIIKGEVVTIDSDYVYINVGMKSDGRVPLYEFDVKPSLGETLYVILKDRKLIDGVFQFSNKAALEEIKWKEFTESDASRNRIITGRIKNPVKSGKIIDCNGISGFLPFSHAADLKNADSSEVYEFKIKSIDSAKRQLLLSRKDFLDEEIAARWNDFILKYKAGDKVTGKVIRFVEFGAFIRIDGVDALLHRNEISWKKVFKQRKILKLNEDKEFLIISIDTESRKISLGLKQLLENPWDSIDTKYKAGDRVKGTAVTLTNFGAFIELEDGVEGFLSASDMSWTKSSANVNDIINKGEEIDAVILDINKEEKKLQLGLKQLLPNPWSDIEKRFPTGSIHKSKIKKIYKFGLFVEIEGDIDGLIHSSDISWEPSGKDLSEIYKENDEIEFKILSIRKDEMKISCGLKQLTKSPWDFILEKYPARSKIDGVISKITPFGLFIKLDEKTEGYVHISESSKKRIEKLEDEFKQGDKVSAVVIGADSSKKRLSLSIKTYEIMTEKEELDKILKSSSSGKVTLGDYVKIKLGE
jgi:small subunit ribosomal protein S1